MERMSLDDVTLTLVIMPDRDDPADDAASRALARELRDLPFLTVDAVRRGVAPPGSKGADLVTLGTWAVSLGKDAIPRFVDYLKSWLSRNSGRKVELEVVAGARRFKIRTDGFDTADVKALIESAANLGAGT
jgi:hypothetical protein